MRMAKDYVRVYASLLSASKSDPAADIPLAVDGDDKVIARTMIA